MPAVSGAWLAIGPLGLRNDGFRGDLMVRRVWSGSVFRERGRHNSLIPCEYLPIFSRQIPGIGLDRNAFPAGNDPVIVPNFCRLIPRGLC